MDSGASSHFTPFLKDLNNPETCNIEVMLADSSRVKATKQGSIVLKFISDQGDECTLHLLRVLFVPGLNTRLFSIPAFTRDSDYAVQFVGNTTQLCFGDGQTYSVPTPKMTNLPTSAYVLTKVEDTNTDKTLLLKIRTTHMQPQISHYLQFQ